MRRPRSFWEARVTELAQGRSVERIARQHGVTPRLLRWWRWRIGTSPTTAMQSPRMIEVLPVAVPTATDRAGVRILVGDVVLELPAAMAAEDIGRIARALCTPC
jgi:transposase-like protein